MKKLLILLVMVVFFLSTITAAVCSDAKYEIPELYMTVTIPDDYTVFTRDTDENDPRFTEYGINAKDLFSLFEQRNIYLNGVNSDGTEEIIITMSTNKDINKSLNLKNASQKDKESFLTASQGVLTDLGATFEGTSEYNQKQALFEVLDFSVSVNGVPQSSRMYGTVINGQFIYFTFSSYAGELTDAQTEVLKQIVDSAVFVEQSGFDWGQVIICGIGGAIIGGILGLIGYLIKKSKRKKPDQDHINPPAVQ